MKHLLCATLALSLLGGSAAVADPHGHGRGHGHGRHDNGNHYGWDKHHRWARGDRLPPQYRSRGYYVDYRVHHLRRPPYGYRWVRVDNDYVMVALATGLIASIIIASH